MTLPLLIDDYKTGPWSATLTTPLAVDWHFAEGTSILGGHRFTRLTNVTDPRDVPVTLDIGATEHLSLTTGFQQFVVVEIGYGWTGKAANAPLGLNLKQLGATAFRATFDGAIGTSLGCTMLALLPDGSPTRWQKAVTTAATPFTLDIPLKEFSNPAGTALEFTNYLWFNLSTSDDVALRSLEVI